MSASAVVRRLGDLLEVQNGYAFDSKSFSPTSGTPLIRIRDLRGGQSTETRYSGDFDPKYLVHAGDLLIGMDGEFACYEWRGAPALLNQRVCRLQSFKTDLSPRYLFYGINQHLKEIEDVTGYATVKHLSSKSVLDIEMPVPLLEDQRRIVSTLDEAFEAIATARANSEQNLRNARELFDNRLYAIFTQHTGGWAKKRLGDCAVIQSGGTPSVSRPEYWNGDIPWYSSGELNGSTTTASARQVTKLGLDNSSAKMFPAGSLLIGMYDTAALKMSILDRNGTFNQAVAGVKPNPDIDLAFVLHAIMAAKPRLLLERRGVRQKNLSLAKVKSISIPLPSTSEQREVVGKIRGLSAETQCLSAVYQRKLAALDALKQSLLHQAFTGAL